jgi:hypothetical protein
MKCPLNPDRLPDRPPANLQADQAIPDRMTPEDVGAQMNFPEYAQAWKEIIAEFLDCVIVKKK